MRTFSGSGFVRLLVGILASGSIFLLGVPVSGQETDEEKGEKAEETDVPSPDEVLDKLDDLYRWKSSHATLVMKVEKPRGTRELTLESWTKGDEHALVVIRKPAREKGTATLRTPEGLWNYAPRADRLIRIPSGLLSDNWMGSHFTNDDLMRETSYEEDYEGRVERATYDGEEVLKVSLKPKEKAPVVYSKLVFYVTPKSWTPLKTDYYDDGEVARTMRYTRVETIDGRRIPTVMTLRPADDDDEMTRVEYKELEFDVDVPDKIFSKRGLRRVAR